MVTVRLDEIKMPAPLPITPAPAGAAPAAPAAAEGGGGLNVQGLPIVKPPYGLLAAINLDRGELLWQTPHGDTPDNIRNHPALRGMNIPKTGQPGASAVGLLVTKTLVISGERDYRVPYTQSLHFYTDLQEMKVPSRLIIYSNAGHWPSWYEMALYYTAHVEWFN